MECPSSNNEDATATFGVEDILSAPPGKTWDSGRRLVLLVFLVVQLTVIGVALWPTCWLLMEYAAWAETPTRWVFLILGAILVFNYAYLLALLALRLVIPKPREGLFPMEPDGAPPREATVYMLNILLSKVRFHTPWAGMFSSVLVSLFPLNLIYPRVFGPKTTSNNMGDSAFIIDPYFVEAGKSVTFGFGSIVACHLFDGRRLYIRRVKIGDYVVIGGGAGIGPGVVIGHHAVIEPGALVAPNTVIGPYEYWGGTPARKIRDLPRRKVIAGKPGH
ncbi:hypothetical protein [Thiococcus pfennigii]|uniref:hypothetical protein n=1 Tax=Thiococcus pfennigii TaxID=1057 RepID=UPI00237BA46E|nr:hypothetical protein [Thiococcus pfennigii]